MISIATPGAYDGLNQDFSTVSATTASVDVYVLSGSASFALYTNGGNTLLASVSSTTTNQWQALTLNVASGNPNLFVLYSAPGGGASFYADNAQVPIASVPEPSSLILALLAVWPGIGYWSRRRRQATASRRRNP